MRNSILAALLFTASTASAGDYPADYNKRVIELEALVEVGASHGRRCQYDYKVYGSEASIKKDCKNFMNTVTKLKDVDQRCAGLSDINQKYIKANKDKMNNDPMAAYEVRKKLDRLQDICAGDGRYMGEILKTFAIMKQY